MTIAPNSEDQQLSASSIEESLQRVLTSTRFKDALQLQSLLKFIVENYIAGRDDLLKERIIGMNVFGRKADYDTSDDPIVRSRVGQLRKRLEQYYESDEARSCSVKITIPSGCYKPSFIFFPGSRKKSNASPPEHEVREEAPLSQGKDPESETLPPQAKSARAPRWRVWAIAFAGLCGLVCLAWIGTSIFQTSELDLFWKPVLQTRKTVIIYHGNITAYMLSADYWRSKLTQIQPSDLEKPGVHAVEPTLADDAALTGKDFRVVPGGFTTPGDLSAAVRVATLLNSWHLHYDLRSGDNLPFADLQSTPAVLIGAYSNSWTLDLTKNLPFFFDRGGRIRESGGQHRYWSDPSGPDDSAADDFAIVARLLDSETGGPVVIIAGTRTCGTGGGAAFVTEPAQMRQLRSIPRDALSKKNLEMVLQIALDHCNPASMKVVAFKSW